MEAARVAVKKGHKVTLFEQKTSLGGQLEIASVPPRKEEMRRFTNYLSHCMKQEGDHPASRRSCDAGKNPGSETGSCDRGGRCK